MTERDLNSSTQYCVERDAVLPFKSSIHWVTWAKVSLESSIPEQYSSPRAVAASRASSLSDSYSNGSG